MRKGLGLVIVAALLAFSEVNAAADLSGPRLGLAFGPPSVYQGQKYISHVKELKINLISVYFRWLKLEPQKGEYNWGPFDSFIEQLDGDIQVLVGIKTISTWGTKLKATGKMGGSSSVPLDMKAYQDFIINLVKRSQGKVKYWMANWEPNSINFWNGTPEEFVRTLNTFYQAVHAAEDSAIVILGGHDGFFTSQGTPNNQEIFDYVFERGKDYFDLFDVRLYKDLYTIPSRVNWFRKRMKDFGFQKPIVCTEYGGPIPQQFPETKAIIKRFRSQAKKKGKKKALYNIWNKLVREKEAFPSVMQMFVKGSSQELESKRDRIQARDMVIRTILAFSAGVEKLWLWNLTEKPHPVLGPHPVFGKLKLMDDRLEEKYTSFYAYQRMVAKLKGVTAVDQLITDRKDVYLFKIEKNTGAVIYVIWEKRDLFNGENFPPTRFSFNINAPNLMVTDVFGKESIKGISSGKVELGISDTPLYLEPRAN